ncbi:hypothetical protein PSN45_004383 [Yamadazyma tenuis]|uniref:Genetic interactor of prohibitin 7, mitochondrial n=1 Tax=Candida tenuis (strain ATCC 10573 / BCRC 21748 / CBS 615 / JCM 9827 / NBRC 10315 / NRRL Y-1498 / VKM Y-70) TaxID=590646 RepID=G3B5Z5_CANTC|nr:uncharacterized protein CANTEDRAFT_135168 [Yamadazyma tenuis ATCC 10573]EGV63339.1 hypothetical protein CANTEDRAFT_135168 [Yamadazyma tenuis ATCC 10573]WEJ96839.1 hypothetical protein PSN45_004383 [Yamadazyma tenuis]
MLRPSTRIIVKVATPRLHLVRWNSSKQSKALSPEEEQKRREEAAKVAMQSIKDLGTMFSNASSDKETEPIDTQPIYDDPSKFGPLSLLHQGQVLQELQAKYDKTWKKLKPIEKRLGYYIAYGNWGVREPFDNWKSQDKPYDLPFTNPVSRVSPKATDKVHKLPPVYLAETPIRKPQFDVKKMDPVTKTFIYLTLLVALLASYRDKNIGEEGKPVELIIRDLHEEERQKRIQEEQAQRELAAQISNRKWYFLWLR